MSDYRRSHHDMGGLNAGPVDRSEHDKAPWEKRVDAIKWLLGDDRRNLIRTDELRRAIEGLGADAYEKYSYYERWMSAVAAILLEKNVLSVDELGRKMAEIEARRHNLSS